MKMENYTPIMVTLANGNAVSFFKLRYQYIGYLGPHNKPTFPAVSLLYQSMCAPVHFHYCLN